MSDHEARAGLKPDRWLLLIHQLPPQPAYLRVKVWRRLQALGAVAVKNTVYALPALEQSQEDFEWLLKEIVNAGAEAMVCEARLIAGLSDGEIRALFDAARDADYAQLAEDVRAIAASLDKDPALTAAVEARGRLAKLKARHAQIVAIDFFGANGREAVDGLIAGLEAALTEDIMQEPPADAAPTQASLQDLKNHVWVTRQGVHVDRIACAWLIRRFIDERAAFKFVPPRGYTPEPDELRFDMFAAEFTHEGDRCSFEVLLARSNLADQGLTAIAEIVHDIDLKDGKFGREEASGIKMLIAGICTDTQDDDQRLERGAAIFDDLYAVFRRKRGRTRADRP